MPRAATQPEPTKAAKPRRATLKPSETAPEPDFLADATESTEPPAAITKRVFKGGRYARFVELYGSSGFSDIEGSARQAGFRGRGVGHRLLEKMAEEIERERVSRAAGDQMTVEEALRLTAGVARDLEVDPKVRLGYIRTVLEVQGALKPDAAIPRSGDSIKKQLEDIVGRVKARVGSAPGVEQRVKAELSVSVETRGLDGAERVEALGVSAETPANSDIHPAEIVEVSTIPSKG